MTKNVLLSTTVSLVALQLGSRLFSFGLNQLLVRSTSPQAFGVATIQFDTLRDTVLFLLREGIRGAVVRTRTDSGSRQISIRSHKIPILLSPLVPLIFFSFYYFTSSSSDSPSYFTALSFYTISTVIELWSEPYYLETLSSWETLTSTRVKIEGLAVIAKALSTLVALQVLQPSRALEAYGLGQIAYSLALCIGLGYALSCRKNKQSISSSAVNSGAKLLDGRQYDSEIKRVGWALTKQSLVKQVLTEGDKLAVSRFGKVEDLGSYAVALNYGSLVARIIFQPLEESSRLYFSSLSSTTNDTTSPQKCLSSLSSIASHLSLVLTFYTHFSLLLIFLVPSYVSPLLTLLLGSKWSSTASSTLIAYVYSLPFLALNGVLEAGVQSFADEKWMKRGSYWMGVCTLGFAGTIHWTMGRGGEQGWGSKGLILGNCVNMAMRIGFSGVFLYTYFRDQLEAIRQGRSKRQDENKEEEEKMESKIWGDLNPKKWMPSIGTIGAFWLGGRICRESEKRWISVTTSLAREGIAGKGAMLKTLGAHLGIGAVVGVCCLLVMYVFLLIGTFS
ncbi:glycolipid translocation protein [Sporobolomyces salmoneus]|uniref:glycolipid translocation protein n=1 Tax=Sporobolomyces salmoneus TaxID=183962 RepID=UPI00316B51F9